MRSRLFIDISGGTSVENSTSTVPTIFLCKVSVGMTSSGFTGSASPVRHVIAQLAPPPKAGEFDRSLATKLSK